MFAKYTAPLLAAAVLATTVFSSPLAVKEDQSLARRTDFPSFNYWGGHASLDHFDDFYGKENFDGSHFNQVFVEDHEIQCRTVSVQIVQQRLVVLQEMAKKIVTELVCDSETQIVTFEQFHASLGGFNRDLRRYSGYKPGYDAEIVKHYGDFYNYDGSWADHDYGFSGHDVGSHTVFVGGGNWHDETSHASCDAVYGLTKTAYTSYD
jgi:hypothetical protein